MRMIRHKLSNESVFASYEAASADLGSFVEAAAKNANSLSSLMRNAVEVACLASVVKPEGAEMAKHLALAARACADLFAAGRSSRVDESIVSADKWITGFFLGQICRSEEVLNSLTLTSSEMLRKSSTTQPEYRYLLVDALRASWSKSSEAKQLLVEVMKATDPERPDIRAAEWVLNIDVPIVRLLFCTLEGSEEFEKTLIHALELHKKYWSKTKQRSRDYLGFLPIELNGICAVAHDRKIAFDVQSEYLPAVLVHGIS